MERHISRVRESWQEKVASTGLRYHSHPDGPYWDESACYRFTSREISTLESAANEVHQRYLEAAQHVVDEQLWDRLHIPKQAVPSICESWERDDFSIYGRFDFLFDGMGPPKLLEYNADTPTALIEASVTQWFWLQELFPKADQFNSIHERLIAAWKRSSAKTLWFAAIQDHLEDEQTIRYLEDTAHQAGCKTQRIFMEEIGWNASKRQFVDLSETPLETVFKLYPWEWMWNEPFAQYLPHSQTRWMEPAWKLLLSNKGILAILHELFPKHPNLLPAYDTSAALGESYVMKPRFSREGANIMMVEKGNLIAASGGDYGAEGYIYQAIGRSHSFAGQWPVCGIWMVDHEAAGLGIREDKNRITGNLSRFLPHYFG